MNNFVVYFEPNLIRVWRCRIHSSPKSNQISFYLIVHLIINIFVAEDAFSKLTFISDEESKSDEKALF